MGGMQCKTAQVEVEFYFQQLMIRNLNKSLKYIHVCTGKIKLQFLDQLIKKILLRTSVLSGPLCC
jgi:hypothetical protein